MAGLPRRGPAKPAASIEARGEGNGAVGQLQNAGTHVTALEHLYRRRGHLLAEALADGDLLERTEQRLCLHLHVLAQAGDDAAAPAGAVDAFRRVGTAILRKRPAAYADALAIAAAGGEEAAGAWQALALMPPRQATLLIDLYQQHQGLRAPLFDLWHRHGADVPDGVLNRACLQRDDPALQVAALRYAAARPHTGVDVFRPYYRERFLPPAMVVAALWGGLRRGDDAAAEALNRVLGGEEEATAVRSVLRLMALAGGRHHLPVLRERARLHPEDGVPLLALAGYPEVMPDVLHALERPESADAAVQAWFWLTGQPLPTRPRLEVATAGGARGGGVRPDAEWAAGWWHGRRDRFPPDARLLFGDPMSAHSVARACGAWAGRRSEDLLDLAALCGLRGFAVHHEDWMIRRRAALQAAAPAPAPPVEVTERDIWERGHFASRR